jgi:PAS domain S-box-containing protein
MPFIVVIDDRPAKRRQYLDLAASIEADVNIEGFANPRAAIEASSDTPPDLVIVGRTMPVLNGVRAIRRFRRIPECENVPVIHLVEPNDLRLRFRALEAGASDVLADPVDPGEFRLRARNLLAAWSNVKKIHMRAELLERGRIAKERRYRRDLRATRNSLRGIVDTVPAMVSVSDRDGNYVFVNQYMASFYGKRPEETMGVPVNDILGKAQGEREIAANREVFKGAGMLSGYEEDITDAHGMTRTFLSTKSALRDDANRVVNIITVSQDITFRKWVESELREAKNAAEAASRVKTEFLANVSHELRTPLNAIIGFAEGMIGDLFGQPDLDRYREYSGHISESARHLKAIIDDILDIASIEGGGLDVLEDEADPATVVWAMVGVLEEQAAQAQVTIHVESGELPLPVQTDAERFGQILKNLMSNAIKFSPEGGDVRIEIAETPDGGVCVSVQDSGAGIATEDLPLATDRFGQLVGDPMSDPIGGMGLGLPLSIGLAELLGARVDIASQKGKGTTVSLIFPPEKLARRGRMAG